MSFEFKTLGGPKPINAVSSIAGAVFYVVPAGKSFTGTIVLNASSGVAFGDSSAGLTTGSSAGTSFPVTLGPGTVVKSVSGTVGVIGIES